MKRFGLRTLLLAVIAGVALPVSMEARDNKVVAQTILHENGHRTDSRRNPQAKVLEEMTFDRRNLVLSRKVFELDESGRALRGLIFNRDKELVGRIGFGFDEFGRMTEERTWDASNRVLRRLMYRYGADGKALKPIVYNYGNGETNPQPRIDGNARSSIATPDVNQTGLQRGDQLGAPGAAPTVPLTSRPGRR